MPPLLKSIAPSGFKPDRLAAICDGVIAIAITLLVLGIEVPTVHEVPKSELVAYLTNSLHSILGYVTSFVLIGTYWLEHYAIFHFLTHVTRPFIALNGLFLLCLTFLPFPTGLQAAYREDELAMVLYAVAHLFCGLSLLSIWLYAVQDARLIARDQSPVVLRSMSRRLMVAPGLSLLAIACAFIDVWASRFVLLSIPLFYLSHRVVDQGWQERAVEHKE